MICVTGAGGTLSSEVDQTARTEGTVSRRLLLGEGGGDRTSQRD